MKIKQNNVNFENCGIDEFYTHTPALGIAFEICKTFPDNTISMAVLSFVITSPKDFLLVQLHRSIGRGMSGISALSLLTFSVFNWKAKRLGAK